MTGQSSHEARRIRSYYRGAAWRPSAGRSFLAAERQAFFERIVSREHAALADLRVVDVGCGSGADLVRWRSLGVPEGNLHGTELIQERVEAARAALPSAAIASVDGVDVPFPSASMDITSASLVLSSILEVAVRRALLAEMRRVTRPGGLIVVYDFRVKKPWNTQVVAIRGNELKDVLGPAQLRRSMGPLLPVLELVLRLPRALRSKALRWLPRTHAVWIWRVPPP